jgi:hypothetical protein
MRVSRDNNLGSSLLQLGPDEPDIWNGIGVEPWLEPPRVALAPLGHAPRDNYFYVSFSQPRALDDFVQDLENLGTTHGHLEPKGLTSSLEPVQMVIDAKELASPDPDHVIGQIGSNKARVKDRNPRLGHRQVLTVYPGPPVGCN